MLFGLCSSEEPPRESAEGRGGPGGRSGPGSVSRFPAVRKGLLVGPWDRAASVDCEASAAALVGAVTGAAAVGRGRLLTVVVVCGGLGVMAARSELGEISGPVEASGVFWMFDAIVLTLSFLLQDSQHSLLYPGMEQ